MRTPKFQLPDDPFYVQDSLFSPPGVANGNDPFPPILRDEEGIRHILANARDGIGLDLEFSSETLRPSILGVSNREMTGAIPWDAEIARLVVTTAEAYGTKIVGHSVIGADRPVLEKALGIKTPLALWDDTMIRHYLCNPDMCKAPSKEEDESEASGGVTGFMNLWTMGSLYTDLPQWKVCRGKACDGPCPLHDAFAYCAIDAWAGLESKFGLVEEMKQKNIPEKLCWDLHVLSEITYKMQEQGIKIDKQYIKNLEKFFDLRKDKLFGSETINGKLHYTLFNPRSVQQVTDYFAKHGVVLEGTDKKNIRKALEKNAKKHGFAIDTLEEAPQLPEELDALYRLYQYKDSGKGLSSWFDGKYVHADDLIHPRFPCTGSSMGRLASAGPNFSNIPTRGFGKVNPAELLILKEILGFEPKIDFYGQLIKGAIVPRDESLDLVKADFSQLEMRVMLHYGGYDLNDLKGDPFKGLVERSAGQFKEAASFLHGSERDIAKSLVHANNYGEGIIILSGKDLEKRKKEIEEGALYVYRNWEYRGGVVGFTGANLAERLFGNKTYPARKKALALQELVNEEFPHIRRLHRKVLRQIEERRGVQIETGRFLPLYGSPEEDAKMGLAMVGQGCGADHMQSVMLRYYEELGVVPLLVVHDEMTLEIPRTWTDKQAVDFMKLMEEPTKRLDGFWCTAKAKRGRNWGDMHAI